MRLLIVDDSSEIRHSLKKTLSSITNIEIVGEAAHVQEAINLIASLKPKIVILDFQLLDGTAIDVLNVCTKIKDRPNFIIFSNYSANPYGKACIAAGADHFFNKCSDLNKFFDLIKNLSSQD